LRKLSLKCGKNYTSQEIQLIKIKEGELNFWLDFIKVQSEEKRELSDKI